MKKIKILLLISIFLLLTISLYGENKGNIGKLHKPSSAQSIDTEKNIDVNNIVMPVTNLGSFAWNLTTGNAGLIFPKGTTNTAVYASGLWIGAKVGNDIRMAVSEYSQEYVPGLMMDSTFTDPNDGAYRVYKLNRVPTADQMTDYNEWPLDQGAPVDSLGKPKILGDQFLWCVYDDADPSAHTNDAGSTAPLGLEVHQSAFAFSRSGALGNTIFMKFKIINRGPNQLDSTYVAVWSDPDLGGASDDLVGCDTLLSLGYCYNATNTDQLYGATPPAVGYDFFEGPIIPGDSTDTAYVSGERRSGFKNLPMTAFNKYINGTDPRSFIQAYQYLKGLNAVEGNGGPYVNPITSETTTFAMSGDPVAGTGWLDANPADRRLMLCSGPFTMMPGDTQEVVVGIIIGQGTDRLNSVSVLKEYDKAAQAVFDLNFVLPPPPPPPSLLYRAYNEAIDLIWGTEPEGNVEISEQLNQEFHFEGYNFWQGESPAGPWKKIATYDISDTIAFIYSDAFDPVAGGVVRQLIQTGSNSGLEQHFYINKDYLNGGKLVNGKTYYFSVTSYSYDVRNGYPYYVGPNLLGYITESLEYPPSSNFVTVVPLSQTGVMADTAEHISGVSDGRAVIDYIYPDRITGHEYFVFFDNSAAYWKLVDSTLARAGQPESVYTVLDSMTDQSGGYTYPIVDGMMVRVMGPSLGINEDLTELKSDSLSFYFEEAYIGGRNAFNNGDYRNFLIKFVAGPGDTTSSGLYQDGSGNNPWGFFRTDTTHISVPFEFWDLGYTTNDTTDDVRIWPLMYDFYGDGRFHTDDYLIILDKNTAGDKYSENFYSNPDHDPANSAYWNLNTADPMSRHDWDYRLAFNETGPVWAKGDSVLLITFKPNTAADIFKFKTYKVTDKNGSFVKNTLDNIWVVPNPFYNRAYNQQRFEHAIQFMNLPPNRWTIRIFNLAGDLVRTLKQADPTSSVFFWDLLTEKGLPVASGIYIYYIEADGLGSTFGKMAIFMEEERLPTF